MQNPVTIVTAFFDINRERRGDGRSIDEYKEWIQKTLQLNCNLYVITESKFRDFFIENRPKEYPMQLKIMNFSDSHYHTYLNRMNEIVTSSQYKSRISYPTRVECVLPEYNVIQYSKFHYLELAIEENPFQTEFFFWMDAGASRFFGNMNLSRPFPSADGISQSVRAYPDLFFAQQRPDLKQYRFDENFLWKADNLVYGGMFGGKNTVVKQIAQSVEKIFVEELLAKSIVNNEQLVLALVWRLFPHLFALCVEPRSPMVLLHHLSK